MSLLLLWFIVVFIAGLFAGSFINYCARRLPYERSIIWPRPRCLSCFQRIALIDCLPLVGYLKLGGRCRTCGTAIPVSYPVVELTTGLLFVALYAIICGTLEVPTLGKEVLAGRRWNFHPDVAPGYALIVFSHHAVLISFLFVASLCDLDDMAIPFSLTLWGTLIGLVFATLFPWPFPMSPADLPAPLPQHPGVYDWPTIQTLYAWPLWYPLPSWLPPGSPQYGLANGLAGALAGMLVLRGVRFLFGLGRGIEGLGMGDADLMMMAGAFIGWQLVVMAFFVAVFPALFFALVQAVIRGSGMLPFGPSLALGVVITVLVWPALGKYVQPLFFEPMILTFVGGGGAVGLLLIAFLLRLVRGLANVSNGSPNGAGS